MCLPVRIEWAHLARLRVQVEGGGRLRVRHVLHMQGDGTPGQGVPGQPQGHLSKGTFIECFINYICCEDELLNKLHLFCIKGGSCGICGSVEHLKSACPRKKEKDEKGEMRLGTIGKGSVDDQQYANATANTKSKKKPKTKKVVSFWYMSCYLLCKYIYHLYLAIECLQPVHMG